MDAITAPQKCSWLKKVEVASRQAANRAATLWILFQDAIFFLKMTSDQNLKKNLPVLQKLKQGTDHMVHCG